MNLIYHSRAVINSIFKTNTIIVQSRSVPFCPVPFRSFSLKSQSRSCLVSITSNIQNIYRYQYSRYHIFFPNFFLDAINSNGSRQVQTDKLKSSIKIRHRDIQHHYTQHNNTEHYRLGCDTQCNDTRHKH
jgi:hypothetical protein